MTDSNSDGKILPFNHRVAKLTDNSLSRTITKNFTKRMSDGSVVATLSAPEWPVLCVGDGAISR